MRWRSPYAPCLQDTVTNMTTPANEIERPVVVPGDRIFLSTVNRADLPTYARWFADLELNAYLGAMGRSFLLDHEHEWYEHMLRAQDLRTFAIVVREDMRMIGNVSLSKINQPLQTAEFGIAIGDKTAWSQGYGSEATRLMVDFGFSFLNLETIYLWHAGFNPRGHRAYLKAGFRDAGRLRGMRMFNGRRYDDILMDITREDFGQSRLTGIITQLPAE